MTSADHPLSALLRLFRSTAYLESRLSPGLGSVHGLALNELLFLLQLSRAPLQRLRRVDLAQRLHTSQSTITRMALPLEKIGLIKREADPRDARVAYVTLTKTGRTRTAEAEATFSRMAAEIFRDRWSDKDIAQLSSLLGRFTAALPGDLTD
ncbi:MAG: MarR family transcriptional regulator [Ferrovibrio sp.]|uniref:MarR family winged helix-turn-helix transcriptional regulator n=1 Tax=Ferrovibrio sp. TaxID=1917215 RepID=UPI002636161F|nr:MarR family transcriptional regulator [Ferrovibrio sp.]MCW0233777.1 MarR family transcriptional regulator [Ferrovibrio sp.]